MFLEIESPPEFWVEKETFQGKVIETLTAEIPTATMDQIAVDWIKSENFKELWVE